MTRCIEILFVVGLVAMVVGSVSAAPLYTDDLVFYYGFDSVHGNGTTVADGSGNGYDGTITGNVTQTTGPYGSAAMFWHDEVDVRDVDWNFITLPAESMDVNKLPVKAITIAAWYNVSVTEDQPQSIFNQWSSRDKWVTTCLLQQRWGGDPVTDSYRFTLRDANGNNVAECRVGENDELGPKWNVWTHLAMTYSVPDQMMYVYENGQLIGASPAVSASSLCTDWGDSDELTPGSTRVSTEGDNCRQIHGALDEVYVFSRALSPAEIANLAAPRLPGDANDDRVVDDKDASILGANWLTSGALWEEGDFNGDDNVNDADAAILAAHWSPGGGEGSVPEPSTLAMLFGAAVMAWLGRRRTW
jgi:hypothetical protein